MTSETGLLSQSIIVKVDAGPIATNDAHVLVWMLYALQNRLPRAMRMVEISEFSNFDYSVLCMSWWCLQQF